jgi:hypothetical protein
MGVRSIVLLCLALAGAGCEEPRTLQDWTPTTRLPAETVEAARFMLANGLGDPKDGTYREATIEVSTVWRGDKRDLKVHAFQIGKTSQVVAWNGLVYDAKSLGASVDLDADVRRFLPASPIQYSYGVSGNSEGGNAEAPFHTVGKLLLLRFGRSDLAEEVNHKLGMLNFTGNSGAGKVEWLRPAMQYLSNRFDRAVTAHMRGDAAAALADAKVIEKALPIFKIATDRVTESPLSGLFAFADVAPDLAKDSARRLSGSNLPLDLTTLASRPKSERVRALIQHLDQVGARQDGQPGGVDTSSSPIVQALFYEGEDAVEPLIDCVEGDTRLTQSVSFPRDFKTHRHIFTVKEVALRLLGRIIDTPGAPGDPKELRAFWRSNRGLSNPERWYRQLADSRNDYRVWNAAAARIMEPSGVRRTDRWVTVPKKTSGVPVLIRGHSLRTDHVPSVSELLARRAIEVSDAGVNKASPDPHKLEVGCRLALALAEWEPVRAAKTLRALTHRTVIASLQLGEDDSAKWIDRLIAKRIQIGDASARADYVDWLRKLRASSKTLTTVALKQLCNSPDSPEYRKIGEDLFSDPASPWKITNILRSRGRHELVDDLNSPIWLIPAFRKSFISALDEKTRISTVRVILIDGRYRLRESVYNGHGDMLLEEKVPPEFLNMEQDYRLCDFLAFRIYRRGVFKKMPEFRPYWPRERRDGAIEEIKRFIRSNGSRIKSILAPVALNRFKERF